MKIRWTQNSVRFRITPSELAAIERGEAISETLQLPGGSASGRCSRGVLRSCPLPMKHRSVSKRAPCVWFLKRGGPATAFNAGA
jgi:hypothetical protein